MTSIHFVGGEKGGEGRSFVCRALIDYHRTLQIPFSAFDTCRIYSDVSRFYRDIEGCEAKGYSREHRWSEIATDVFKKELTGSVIVNLHTHGMAQLVRPWLEESKQERMAELRRKDAIIWFVSIGSGDSYRLLEKSLAYFQGRVRHILVRNLSRRSFWGIERVDKKFADIATEHALSVITFPSFPDGAALDLILDDDVPYLEAKQHPDLSFAQKRRASIFLDRAFTALESANAIQINLSY